MTTLNIFVVLLAVVAVAVVFDNLSDRRR